MQMIDIQRSITQCAVSRVGIRYLPDNLKNKCLLEVAHNLIFFLDVVKIIGSIMS